MDQLALEEELRRRLSPESVKADLEAARAEGPSGGVYALGALADAALGQTANIQRLKAEDAALKERLGKKDQAYTKSLMDYFESKKPKSSLEDKIAEAMALTQARESVKKPTKDERQAATFGTRASEANAQLEKTISEGYDPTTRGAALQRSGLGKIGEFVGVSEKPESAKALEQSERNFINSILREESDATITDAEFANAEKQYFPRFGDTPEVLEQKRLNRETAISGLLAEGEKALPKLEEKRATKFGKKEKPSVPSIGMEKNGYRYKGGNPASKDSWEKI